MSLPASPADSLLIAEVQNGVGYITLNRPASLNTLNLQMVRSMHTALMHWASDERVKLVVLQGAGEKALCAGGDVRRIRECILLGDSEYHAFFAEEFALNEYIYSYPKPYIALMHGIVMGGGMGISQGASCRVVCENTKIAMPETAIGYFPDVGASYFLTRSAPALGVYLGLSGKNLNHADALYCGMADYSLPLAQWADLRTQLEGLAAKSTLERDDIAMTLSTLGGVQRIEGSTIEANAVLIERVFSADSLQAILQSLQACLPNAWAQETLAAMQKNSPLAMATTLQLLNQGAKLSLSQCFATELLMTEHWLSKGEFAEGVRAALIDKDKNPQWKFSLAEITPSFLKAQFPPLFQIHS